ncbi:MAG: GreA/GreB family elongation factor [Spartobacteria bacterium]
MSKAFTREENDGPEVPDLPPVASALPIGAVNYMTADGAERLRNELARLVESDRPLLVDLAKDDPAEKRRLTVLDQRIFQIEQSLGNAQVVTHTTGPADRVTFGATVTVREKSGEESRYQIVGIDETDIESGAVSWLSPIARALMNANVGQRVRFKFPSGEAELEIVAIVYE